jgi:predicted transcriptional regulator
MMKEAKNKEKFFTVRLDLDTYTKLEKIAEREKSSVGRIVRLAIDDLLQKDGKR